MKTICYSKAADAALAKMPKAQAEKIEAKIEQLALAPETLGANVKRLQGSESWRLRVDRYRVIYDDGIVLDILEIGQRKEIYR